ncbi:unnamed protein product [Closterium sp. NIES-65]|nr:unnamed protein product [Closterium sp. NIES-65]
MYPLSSPAASRHLLHSLSRPPPSDFRRASNTPSPLCPPPSAVPPAVRINDELRGVLTRELRGEGLVRACGLSTTVVRPYALSEELVGAALHFHQGDNMTHSARCGKAWG